MKTTYKPLPKSQAQVTVIVENKKVQEQIDKVIDQLGKNIEIKGFRKGHVPKQMTIDKIGPGRIQQETLDPLVQQGYLEAVKEHKFYPISQPSVALKKFNLEPNGTIKDDLEFELTIDLMPEIKLGDYTKIKVKDKQILDKKIEVTDEEVNKIVEHLQRQKSTMTDTTEKAKKGDWVEISFSGTLNKVPQERLASKNHPLVIGSGAMVPGFEDAIIGMEIDKPKDIKITFPKDYFAKDLAGKDVEFKVTVHKVKKIKLPEVNEKFAKEYGHDSIDDLKKAINQQLTEEKETQKTQEIDSAVLEEAKKLLKVEIPEGLITQEVHRMIDRMEESVKKQGVDFDRYLESVKKTHGDLHKDYEPQARANIEIGFMLGEVIKKEKLDPNDKEAPQKALAKLVEYAKKNSQKESK